MDASYGIASEKTRTTRRQVLKDKKKSLEQLQITMQQKMFLDVFRCIIITYWCILLRRLKSKKKKTRVFLRIWWRWFLSSCFEICVCLHPVHVPSRVISLTDHRHVLLLRNFQNAVFLMSGDSFIPLSLLILFKSSVDLWTLDCILSGTPNQLVFN